MSVIGMDIQDPKIKENRIKKKARELAKKAKKSSDTVRKVMEKTFSFGRSSVKKTATFISDVGKATVSTVISVTSYLWHNAEGIAILSLASIGVTAILTELPFMIAMPLWIESSMVLPVISTGIVWLLAYIMEWRRYVTLAKGQPA